MGVPSKGTVATCGCVGFLMCFLGFVRSLLVVCQFRMTGQGASWGSKDALLIDLEARGR